MDDNVNNNNVFSERNGLGEVSPTGSAPRAGEVYVVEDDALLRHTILRTLRGAQVMAHAYDRAAAFLDHAPRLPPGCLVTDLRMPGMDGLELIRRVRAAGLPFSTILMTGNADIRIAVEAMKAGASDFVEKPFEGATLITAIERALQGRPAARPRDAARDALWLAAITARERQVLEGVVDGLTSKMIARHLGISVRTVEVYRSNLMRKTGAATRSELVRRALVAWGGAGDEGFRGLGDRSGGARTTGV